MVPPTRSIFPPFNCTLPVSVAVPPSAMVMVPAPSLTRLPAPRIAPLKVVDAPLPPVASVPQPNSTAIAGQRANRFVEIVQIKHGRTAEVVQFDVRPIRDPLGRAQVEGRFVHHRLALVSHRAQRAEFQRAASVHLQARAR